jgi:hypothetical protein
MTAIYCLVDDFLKARPALAAWRRSNHRAPAFTDAEVITVALLQGCFGCATLKRTYYLVRNNYKGAFPLLPSYAQWLSRLHALSPLVGRLLSQSFWALPDHLFVIDSKPIPVCKPIRHGRVRLLRDEGAYWGKNKAGWYFGFKLHALAHHNGAILCAFLTPANVDDRDAACALADAVEGAAVLADVGYLDAKDLEPLLWQEWGLLLITPAHAGEQRPLVSSVRERIETTFSGLWSQFIDRVLSRSFQGLWSTIKLKMLHYNLTKAGVIPATVS